MKLQRRSFISSLPMWFLGGLDWIAGIRLFRSATSWWSVLVQPEKNGKAERLRAWEAKYRKMRIEGTVIDINPDTISALLALSDETFSNMASVEVGEVEGFPPCLAESISTSLSARHGPESRMTFDLFMEIIDLEDEIGLQKLADEMEIECRGNDGGVTADVCRQRHLSLAELGDPSLCKHPQVCVKKHLSWIGHCISTRPDNGYPR